MRLIDADALMPNAEYKGRYDVVTAYDIANAPTIELERKKGKWNTYYHGVNDFTFSCNQCGYSAPYGLYGGIYSQRKFAFCPNCGADMRGEQNDSISD